jgi:hypothetical protein
MKLQDHNQIYVHVNGRVSNLLTFKFVLLQASPRLKLDETVVKKLLFRLRSEIPNETWFDEVQATVYEKLQVCYGIILFTKLFALKTDRQFKCLNFVTLGF